MNGNWLYSGSLPAYYYDRLGRFVRVYVPNGYPYNRFREHSRRYTRPGPRNREDGTRPGSDNRPRPRDNARPESRPGERERPREQHRPHPESRPQPRQNDSGERTQSDRQSVA